MVEATPLHDAVRAALRAGSRDAMAQAAMVPAGDERDGLLTLLAQHDLWMAPIDLDRQRARLQGDPATGALKRLLEDGLLARVQARMASLRSELPDGVAGMRRVAALDLVPEVYSWLEAHADWDELVRFLTVEGGPDAGFDDLVALAQVGLRDDPKVALAENYWDEMGRGSLDAVHTRLHDDLVAAVAMERIPRTALPTEALERAALGGVLATNRYLQPELLGALGLLEMQAGPRCRAVVRAMRRLGAGAGALAFYQEHAEADPRHGKAWLDRVVAPLATDVTWARRMVDGALWRHDVNRRFFDHMAANVDVDIRVSSV